MGKQFNDEVLSTIFELVKSQYKYALNFSHTHIGTAPPPSTGDYMFWIDINSTPILKYKSENNGHIQYVPISANSDSEDEVYIVGEDESENDIPENTVIAIFPEEEAEVIDWTNYYTKPEINEIIKKTEGKSAYQIAVEHGFKGTEEEWLESLKVNIEADKINLKIDNTLKVNEDGSLGVNTATEVEEDNTLPITSAAVHTTVGNIEVLLANI